MSETEKLPTRNFVGFKDSDEILSSAATGFFVGVAASALIGNVLFRVGLKSYYGWARAQDLGSRPQRHAEMIKNTTWLADRCGINKSFTR